MHTTLNHWNIQDITIPLPDKFTQRKIAATLASIDEKIETNQKINDNLQQQARAIYKESPVLILDEPTAAMDPIAEQNVYLQYNELSKNKTAFFISHRLSSTRFCDRIILIDGGKIREAGTHDELMDKGGLYHDMYMIQSRYYQEGVSAI